MITKRKRVLKKRKTRKGPYIPSVMKGFTTGTGKGAKKTVDWVFYGLPSGGTYVQDAWTGTPPSFTQIPIYNTTSGSSCGIQVINDTVQGNGVGQRIGQKIRMKSLRLRLGLGVTGNNTQSYALQYKIAVIYDKQTGGAYPNFNGMYNFGMYTGGAPTNLQTMGPFCSIAPGQLGRFIVLYDKIFNEPNFALTTSATHNVTGDTSPSPFLHDVFLDLRGLETYYNNAGDSTNPYIADIQTGGLYLVVIGQNSEGSNNWSLEGCVRLRFYDA